MFEKINAVDYNLSSRVVLRVIGDNHIAIVKRIKSRIIQKDAIKIIEMAKHIQVVDSSLAISLICTSAICSKSLALLKAEGIGVIIEEL